MRSIKHTLRTWPRSANGQPIFRTSDDAIFFAQLAFNSQNVVDAMKAYRERVNKDLRKERAKARPDLERIFEYAVKAQFFRECFMEILRIKDEEAQ